MVNDFLDNAKAFNAAFLVADNGRLLRAVDLSPIPSASCIDIPGRGANRVKVCLSLFHKKCAQI